MPLPASAAFVENGIPARAFDWPRLLGFVAATFGSASLTVLVLI
ncbi:MAG TPA: hypothetical protein VG936_15750 [Lacunisphaera sp.]|nr:hypothetical protein [Lacunisphaera sp.]